LVERQSYQLIPSCLHGGLPQGCWNQPSGKSEKRQLDGMAQSGQVRCVRHLKKNLRPQKHFDHYLDQLHLELGLLWHRSDLIPSLSLRARASERTDKAEPKNDSKTTTTTTTIITIIRRRQMLVSPLSREKQGHQERTCEFAHPGAWLYFCERRHDFDPRYALGDLNGQLAQTRTHTQDNSIASSGVDTQYSQPASTRIGAHKSHQGRLRSSM